MGKKIREQDVEQWMLKGAVKTLAEHWAHPVVAGYRKNKLESLALSLTPRNAWAETVRNGETFVFLMQHDNEFRKFHSGLKTPYEWFDRFDKFYYGSWGFLDIAPGELQGAGALKTLDLLMRVGQRSEGEYAGDETVRMVRAKIGNEMHGFYRRFQQQGALTAIAWMDNEDVWVHQKPRMANMMRHAASHNPNDVLGAYLIWACNAGCKSHVHDKQDPSQNGIQMQQLRVLAERVGLDTSSYDDHANHCKTLHEGLGLALNGENVAVYVQGTNMVAAPLAPGDELGSLFI